MLSSWLLPVSSMAMAIAFVRSSSTSPAEHACLVCSPGEYCADIHQLQLSRWMLSVVLVEPYCDMVVRRWAFVVDSIQTVCAEGGGLGFRAPGFFQAQLCPTSVNGTQEQDWLMASLHLVNGRKAAWYIVPAYTYTYKNLTRYYLALKDVNR